MAHSRILPSGRNLPNIGKHPALRRNRCDKTRRRVRTDRPRPSRTRRCKCKHWAPCTCRSRNLGRKQVHSPRRSCPRPPAFKRINLSHRFISKSILKKRKKKKDRCAHFVLLRGHIDHPISLDAVASVGRCAMAARLARKLADWLAHVAHRVVSCRSVAVVTRAHVGRRTRPVHASFLAHRFAHVPGVIR